MQSDGVSKRQISFAIFLQSLAAVLLVTAGIVRWAAFGFDAWSLAFVIAGAGAATAAAFLVKARGRL